MNAFALHDTTDQREMVRWGASAAVIVAAHVGLIALGIAWYTHSRPSGVAIPAIMIDLAPSSSAPRTQPMDIAPGPEMQQADVPPSPPEPPKQESVQEQIARLPERPDRRRELLGTWERALWPERDA